MQVERTQNAGWTHVKRRLNARRTHAKRRLNARWTHVERTQNASWTHVERTQNAGWTHVERTQWIFFCGLFLGLQFERWCDDFNSNYPDSLIVLSGAPPEQKTPPTSKARHASLELTWIVCLNFILLVIPLLYWIWDIHFNLCNGFDFDFHYHFHSTLEHWPIRSIQSTRLTNHTHGKSVNIIVK
jgi:hypothetical protein